jgi:WD40 repeat protein
MPVVFARDGKTLAAGDASGSIYLWDLADTGAPRHWQGDPVGMRALAFTADSQILASAGSGDKDVKLWKVPTLERITTLTGFDTAVQCLAISPDSRLLATGTRDGTLSVWDLVSFQNLATLPAHQGSILGVAFSPDSRTLATAGEDRLARLWNMSDLSHP